MILLPLKSLVQVMLISQTLNGLLLLVILITMLVLINDKRSMGRLANGRVFNVLAWGTVVALIGLTAVLVVTTVAPGVI